MASPWTFARDGTNVYSNVSQHSNVLLPIHTQTQERIGRGVRNALVRMYGSKEGVLNCIRFPSAHMCTVSEDVMTLKVYTRHEEYLTTQFIYNVHGLSLDFCCTRIVN